MNNYLPSSSCTLKKVASRSRKQQPFSEKASGNSSETCKYVNKILKKRYMFNYTFNRSNFTQPDITLKVHQCRFQNFLIYSNSCKNNTLKISHC